MSDPRVAELEATVRALRAELEYARAEAENARAELRGAQAELVGTAKMAALGQLIAGIAHEINTPLGALHSNHDTLLRALAKLSDILEDERVEADELEQLRRVVRAIEGIVDVNTLAVERMVGLIANLRSFGRPDRAETDRVDLHEGIESTLALLQHRTTGRIAVRREYGTLPLVECAPQQINQVVMNLLMNAIQAITENGEITVRTAADEGGVRIEIGDNGVGIKPENLKKIFEPGFTTKGARVGMGLGLLISSQIVDRHGGTLTVESEPGSGTVFTVRLPLALPKAADRAQAETSNGGVAT